MSDYFEEMSGYVRARSKLGIFFCAVYVISTCLCIYFGLRTDNYDAKGHYVLLQLPLALQMAALSAIGLAPLLVKLSWPAAYVIIGLPTLVLLYYLGRLLAPPPLVKRTTKAPNIPR